MAERLLITNFAGLDIDIELGHITLFIGPQASGKSICAKCIYLFRSFVPELLASAAQAQDRQSFETTFLNRFREYFPNLWRAGASFRLRYESGEAFVELAAPTKSNTLVANLTYSSFLQDTAAEMRRIVQDIRKPRLTKEGANTKGHQAEWALPSRDEFMATYPLRNQAMVRSATNWATRQAFVIAGRAFLATLRNNILSVLAAKPVADPSLREFIQLYENTRRNSPDILASLSLATVKLVEAIIRGRLLIEGDEDYIELSEERLIPLVNASSGQQEAFSLLMILLSLVSPFPPFYSTLYAEEPEAHLFPESQLALARLMARVYNTAARPVQYVITTHSPYLLAVFNNLVYAHQVEQAVQKNPPILRRLSRVVPKAERLPLADFRAYGLEAGKARPIINNELGLLSASLLDSASDKINQQFSKLTSLDPSTHI